MQIQFGLSNFSPEWSEAVVCVGTFDGVHLGHQAVILQAVEVAREQGLPCCLLTFDRHPAATLAPDRCPPAILSLETRLKKFEELGIAVTVIQQFDYELSQIEAEDFLSKVLIDRFKAVQLVVGHDFAMGKGRKGDAEWLRARVATQVVPPFEVDGTRVSSSLVRALITKGELANAERLLGEPFTITGVVIRGDQLGRSLGYPTANVARGGPQVIPPDGVYAGTFKFGGRTFSAAVSIGTRPSVGGTDRRTEAYCLDYSGGEFYGESCVLELHEFVRGQESFDSLEELIEQIGRDTERIRELEALRRAADLKHA
jgi:riboflavin kinase/FMN adenylyltransferase